MTLLVVLETVSIDQCIRMYMYIVSLFSFTLAAYFSDSVIRPGTRLGHFLGMLASMGITYSCTYFIIHMIHRFVGDELAIIRYVTYYDIINWSRILSRIVGLSEQNGSRLKSRIGHLDEQNPPASSWYSSEASQVCRI